MTDKLRELIEKISAVVEKDFNGRKVLMPIWYGETETGDVHIFGVPEAGDGAFPMAIIRLAFAERKIIRCVGAFEAWMILGAGVDSNDVMKAARAREIHKHPDRIEVMSLNGEDESRVLGCYRRIIRKVNGGPNARLDKAARQRALAPLRGHRIGNAIISQTPLLPAVRPRRGKVNARKSSIDYFSRL